MGSPGKKGDEAKVAGRLVNLIVSNFVHFLGFFFFFLFSLRTSYFHPICVRQTFTIFSVSVPHSLHYVVNAPATTGGSY